jgi:hypothetical protein
VEVVHARHLVAVRGGNAEPVTNRYPFDHQDAVLRLDLADRIDVVLIWIDFDLTRLQRAGKGAGQSAPGRGDHVVERRGMSRILAGADTVMLGDFRVHTERHGLLLGWEVR